MSNAENQGLAQIAVVEPAEQNGPRKKIRQPLSYPTKGAGGPTGTWRSQRPILNQGQCTGCLLCWIYCPEGVIARADRAIDYQYCKGCGICAQECPVGAICMVREGEEA